MKVTRSYEIKLKPNKSQMFQLNNYFYEAKILYNYLLNCSNIFAVHSCKIKHVFKYDKDRNKINVVLSYLPSKLKQNVHRGMIDAIKSLSALKRKGKTVGRLKFKSEITTIDIDNQSYFVVDKYHIKLLGFRRKKIRCLGLHQLDDSIIKFRNAKLIKRDNEFYLKICVLKEVDILQSLRQDDVSQTEQFDQNIGIDFGIADTITLSNGQKLNCKIEETACLKKLQKKFARSKLLNSKRTNNQQKLLVQIHKEYRKILNRKKDFTNKFIHQLDSNYTYIVFQDDQIRGWKNLKSCRCTIQHSCLGTIKQRLISKHQEQPNRYIMLDRWTPTTQSCPKCHKKNPHSLDKRIYQCSCGYTEDRDVHAAKSMLLFANLSPV